MTADPPQTPTAEEVLAVHRALTAAGLPHAIGGAVALAHYAVPRPTPDIDVNVFVAPERRPEVEAALASLPFRDAVHVFLDEDPLHEAMPAAAREVPWAGATIPLVSPEHLVVRKTLLGRPKDRVDIASLRAAVDDLDEAEVDYWVERLGT